MLSWSVLESLDEKLGWVVAEEWYGWHYPAAGMWVAVPHSAGGQHGLRLGQKPGQAH